MSEYIGGGELFDTIRKFPYKLVQLYVAEIAVALGMDENIWLLLPAVTVFFFTSY